LVRLDHDEARRAEVGREPLRAHEPLRAGVLGALRGGRVGRDGHGWILRDGACSHRTPTPAPPPPPRADPETRTRRGDNPARQGIILGPDDVPHVMRAIRAMAPGGTEVMSFDELADPAPGPGQVLVAVEAAGVNFIDVYHREGVYPVSYPRVLGTEGAG